MCSSWERPVLESISWENYRIVGYFRGWKFCEKLVRSLEIIFVVLTFMVIRSCMRTT